MNQDKQVKELKLLMDECIKNDNRIKEINEELKKLKNPEEDINDDFDYLFETNNIDKIQIKDLHIEKVEKVQKYTPTNKDYLKKICLKVFNDENITQQYIDNIYNNREEIEIKELKMKKDKKPKQKTKKKVVPEY
jgi:hypothetical protein